MAPLQWGCRGVYGVRRGQELGSVEEEKGKASHMGPYLPIFCNRPYLPIKIGKYGPMQGAFSFPPQHSTNYPSQTPIHPHLSSTIFGKYTFWFSVV